MSWGNSLLGIWDAIGNGLSEFFYAIKNFFTGILYVIWMLLARLVETIEVIFRQLAGLDSADGSDLVSTIINNDSVKIIFSNLVGFATALMIFFTIFKIIQDHYKDKDGGNPYKVCLRTFKGMLMFFFVGIAVSVGLFATGVIFRGLDSATKGGDVTLAGQVFKAMASEANLKRLETENDGGMDHWWNSAFNKRLARVTAGSPENGKIVLVKMKGNKTAGTSSAQLRDAYLRLNPDYKYGIVSADGKVTPLATGLKKYINENNLSTAESLEDYVDSLLEYSSETDGDWEDGTVSAGFKNDILQSLSINIQPSISLTWSPVDIVTYNYELMNYGEPDRWDVNVTMMGTGFNISFSREYAKYVYQGHDKKSLEDSAKVFGITATGKASLQGPEASASFSLETFDTSKVNNLISSVLVNVLYTNLTKLIVEAIPKFPASFSVAGVPVNLVQLLGPLIFKCLESINNEAMGDILPALTDEEGNVVRDEDGEPMLMVEPFSLNTTTHNGGVWVSVNTKSESMPISIERYQIDGNFTELWGQLTDGLKDLISEFEQVTEQTWETFDANSEILETDMDKIQEQTAWISYAKLVDKYNLKVKSLLPDLGNLLNLYDKVMKAVGTADDTDNAKKNAELERLGYNGNYEDLEEETKDVFGELVAQYNSLMDSEEDVDHDIIADAIYTQSLYQPIIAFPKYYTDKYAANATMQTIRDLFVGGSKKDTVDVNMYISEMAESAFRLIDWEPYGDRYYTEFGKNNVIGDLYCTDSSYEVTEPETEQNKKTLSNSFEALKFIKYGEATESAKSWETGFKYFLDAAGTNNPFVQQLQSNTNINLIDNSYWGNRGLTINGERYYVSYVDGMPVKDERNIRLGSEIASASIMPQSSYVSTAQSNEFVQSKKLETLAELNNISDTSNVDTTLSNKFAQNIITFRPLDELTVENDISALKEWVAKTSNAVISRDHDAYSVSDMSPAQVDAIMAQGSGQRAYAMLTKNGYTAADDAGRYQSYIGQFSYANLKAVGALYDYGRINYVIGFIAIVSASGVYLNFAFGLIQRAVNMAVLYVMSPIVISFYPFDDGSKFNSQFVTPFYKEAISAFAVIVSLNIFILLLNPLQVAVENVTGNGAIGWLALVAMVSMLPKVRETIQGLLGAGSLAQKSIGQMIDDATGAMKNPVQGLKSKSLASARQNLTKMRNGLREIRNTKGQAKNVAQQEEKEKLENLKKEGKLSWIGQRRLDKLNGKIDKRNKRQEREEKLNQALQDGDGSGLKGWQKHRFNQLNKAAARQVAKDAGEKGKDWSPEKKEAEKKKLLADKGWQKTVGGVAVAKSLGKAAANWEPVKGLSAAKIAGGVAKLGKGVAKGAKNIAGDIWHNTQGARNVLGDVGRTFKRHFGRGTTIGEWGKRKFDQMKADDKSLIGSFIRDHAVDIKDADVEKFAKKEVEDYKKKHSIDSSVNLAMLLNNEKKMAADKKYHERAVKETERINEKRALETANNIIEKKKTENKNKAVHEILEETWVDEFKKQDPKLSDKDAKAKARAEIDKYKDDKGNFDEKRMQESFVKESAEKLLRGEEVFGMQMAKANVADIERELRELGKGGSEAVKLKLDAELAEQSGLVKNLGTAMSDALQLDSKEDEKKLYEIIDKSKNDSSITTNDLIKQISAEFSGKTRADGTVIDQDAIMSVVTNHVAEFQKIQTYSEENIARLKVVLDAEALNEKGLSLMMGKVGDLVSKEACEELAKVYNNVFDASINSVNPDSLGSKYREIDNDASLNESQKAAERARIKDQMMTELNNVFHSFIDQQGDKVREYKAAKTLRESVFSTESNPLLSSFQEQMEFQWKVNVELPAMQVIANDGKYQDMMMGGDPAEVGLVTQRAINAVKSGDYQAAYDSGMDKETIDKFIEWNSNKNTKKYLDQLFDASQFNTAFMGNLNDTMGGDSFAGATSAMANLYRVAFGTLMGERMREAAKMKAEDEARAIRTITDGLPKLDSIFQSQMWDEVIEGKFGELKDLNGNIIQSNQQLCDNFKSLLHDIQAGTKSLYDDDVSQFMTILNKTRDRFAKDPGYLEHVDFVTGLTSAAHNANKFATEQNYNNNLAGKMIGAVQDAASKIK